MNWKKKNKRERGVEEYPTAFGTSVIASFA